MITSPYTTLKRSIPGLWTFTLPWPNSYTLLCSLPPMQAWYTVFDLKDDLFSLPLAPKSLWMSWYNVQLIWTKLPKDFKNSPTIFGKALHEDLREYWRTHPQVTLLQYVDDLLIAVDTEEDCKVVTSDFTYFLGNPGGTVHQLKRPKSAKLKWLVWDIYSREDNIGSLKPIKRLCLKYPTLLPGQRLENSLGQLTSVISGFQASLSWLSHCMRQQKRASLFNGQRLKTRTSIK